VAALAVSLVLHLVAGGGLRCAGSPTLLTGDLGLELTDVEIPAAAPAHPAGPDRAPVPRPAQEPVAPTATPSQGGIAPAAPAPRHRRTAAAGAADAGPAGDAGARDAAVPAGDAGVPGAADAAAPVPSVASATGAGRDAVTEALASHRPSEPVAASRDAGPAATAAAPGGPDQSPGGVDLGPYVPAGDVVTVLLRLDRLRGTEWAAPALAVLAPMPDYQMVVGRRDAAVLRLFDTLLISSSDPRRVTATTLVARTRRSHREVRSFLARREAPVSWTPVRGGALGRRQPSVLVPPGDRRVFLQPLPGWIVLAQPEHLGALLTPARGALDEQMAAPGALPGWLAAVREVENVAGGERGPAMMVSAQSQGGTLRLPGAGAVEVPRRAALALEITEGGFHVHGQLTFATGAQASAFVRAAERQRRELLASLTGNLLLRQFHLYNPLKGLSLRVRDNLVSYATSASVADAHAILERLAEGTREFFARQARTPR
jgi:hypothetical protein